MMGNDQLNETKLQNVLGSTARPAHPEELLALTGADAGSIGPIGLKGKFKILEIISADSTDLFSLEL